MSKIDLNEFKSFVPNVKDAIRKALKVDAGTQSTYDIMAASRGFPNYHSVKAQSKNSYYELRTNMGTREAPFHVVIEVGHQIDRGFAEIEARKLLKGCQQFQTWVLYCDGEKTHIKYETTPEPERGLVYQIEITGDTLSDVEIALGEVQSRIDNVMGFDRNESGSFSFQRAGEEVGESFGILDEIDVEQVENYAVIDSEGVIEGFNTEEDMVDGARRIFKSTKLWKHFVGQYCQVSLEVLLETSENEFDLVTYCAIGKAVNGEVKIMIRGHAGDVIEGLKENTHLMFNLYEEFDYRS